MTTVVSWNVQAGLGVDGRVDFERIAAVVRAIGDTDVICLQEIEHSAAAGDQFAAVATLFPGYARIDGPSIERNGSDGPYRFGNLVLSRLPVLSALRHLLPWPPAPGIKHMPRQATEVTVATAGGPLRVVTTHLEYHAEHHRMAQVARLRELHDEAAAQIRAPAQALASGPYAGLVRPDRRALFCGDFNMELGWPEYDAMLKPFESGTPALVDAWTALYPERPHDPTCGIFDHKQWPAGAHCRDFFFVTEDLAAKLAALTVDVATDASDHQPLALVIAD
jgi:endonuclease/exonuclease/phosphatase family metal-dependent hydrolase